MITLEHVTCERKFLESSITSNKITYIGYWKKSFDPFYREELYGISNCSNMHCALFLMWTRRGGSHMGRNFLFHYPIYVMMNYSLRATMFFNLVIEVFNRLLRPDLFNIVSHRCIRSLVCTGKIFQNVCSSWKFLSIFCIFCPSTQSRKRGGGVSCSFDWIV